MNINDQIQSIVENVIKDLNNTIQQQVADLVRQCVADYIKTVSIDQLFETEFKNKLASHDFYFPESSIPAHAINFTDFTISGNHIQGGIITNFGSTGIDDKASICQLSIFDETTVVENNLLTNNLTVKGHTVIEGDLTVKGTLPEDSPLFVSVVNAASEQARRKIDASVFQGFANLVFDQIKTNGIDLSGLKFNGQDIINGSALSSTITESNLQTVGSLRELQVSGESLLSQTLYTTNLRVGINTTEPSQALTVWDQEIEIGFGKKSKNTAIIGSTRNQTLIIGTNNKDNLTLDPDGSTTVSSLRIGTMTFSVSDLPPANNQPRGTVVFNSNPSLGGPMGWVSLGDARWANFGLID